MQFTNRTNHLSGKKLFRVLLFWNIVSWGFNAKAQADNSPYDHQIGIVVESDTGVCLTIADADLHAGDKVQVVVPTKP